VRLFFNPRICDGLSCCYSKLPIFVQQLDDEDFEIIREVKEIFDRKNSTSFDDFSLLDFMKELLLCFVDIGHLTCC
jgi:hypothetical protein